MVFAKIILVEAGKRFSWSFLAFESEDNMKIEYL